MKYRVFILIYMLAAGVVLDLDAQSKAKAKTKTPPAVEDEGPPPMAVPPSYRYDRKGRRDPFLNPIPKPVASEDKPPAPPERERPPGLRGVLVSEATVTAIVSSKDASASIAVIAAPGGKTYFARLGDALFDAVVKEIRSDGVIFALSTPGRTSTNTPREIERKVRTTPGAK